MTIELKLLQFALALIALGLAMAMVILTDSKRGRRLDSRPVNKPYDKEVNL